MTIIARSPVVTSCWWLAGGVRCVGSELRAGSEALPTRPAIRRKHIQTVILTTAPP